MAIVMVMVMIVYAPGFSSSCADVGAADFLIRTTFRSDCNTAHCMHFSAYLA